jgi:cell division protein FtsI/penicillin-binding protein 2
MKRRWIVFLLFLIACTQEPPEKKIPDLDLDELAKNNWPSSSHGLELKYTFDHSLVTYLREVAKSSRSDQIAISVIDNESGKILALIGRDNIKAIDIDELAVSSLSPAASLIKLVTSADLVENHGVTSNTRSNFTGRRVTLYKRQLVKNNKGKVVSLRQAFSKSNNVIFAKLAQKYSSPFSLYKKAEMFFFNKKLPIQGISASKSFIPIAQSDYEFAEISSGLNKKTLMSPLHAAFMIQNIVSGKDVKPLELLEFSEMKGPSVERSVNDKTAKTLIGMMNSVVEDGTARKLTRKISSKIRDKIEFGGKTGRMTGGVPFGTRDWFAFYIRPKDLNHKGWSVSVMINNGKTWSVRPTFIAKKLIEYYYSKKI